MKAAVAALVLLAVAPAAAARAAVSPADAPLSVNAKLAPLAAGFGDPVEAEVRVLLDPARVQPESLRLRTEFTPWREERRIVRRAVGDLVEVSFLLRLTCHGVPCVQRDRQWQYLFPASLLRYREGQRGDHVRIAWPPLEVSTRLPLGFAAPDDGTLDAPPVWRASVEVPEPSFRIRPALLQAALAAAGLLLCAASLAFVLVVLRRPAARREAPPLERALARLARARTAEERRAALEAVAVELHPALAAAARELAWREEAPSEPAARALGARVRETARETAR